MNAAVDAQAIQRLTPAQRGVFSKADLQTLLADPHPASFVRRVQRLIDAGCIQRFIRGWYVTPEFHLPTLAQRIAPDGYVSLDWVLARELLIGPRPERQLTVVRPGRARGYQGLGYEVVQLHIADHLDFGYRVVEGVRYADAEKALLDALYYHLRGRRYTFDIYSDVDASRLDRDRLRGYLGRYRNPKFISFAEGVLGPS